MTKRQFSFDWKPDPALGRQDYLVTACNQAALDWVERWPDWNSHAAILWGPPSSGKTHLAHIWAAEADAQFLNPAWAEQDFMQAALSAKTMVLDNADAGVKEEWLLHALNAAKNQGGYLLLTAQKPASQWGVRLPDLASRLNALPQIGIHPPDDEMMKMLMTKLFADRQLQVMPEVVDYAATRLDRSYAAIFGFVAAIDRISLEKKRNITISLARELIETLPS